MEGELPVRKRSSTETHLVEEFDPEIGQLESELPVRKRSSKKVFKNVLINREDDHLGSL